MDAPIKIICNGNIDIFIQIYLYLDLDIRRIQEDIRRSKIGHHG